MKPDLNPTRLDPDSFCPWPDPVTECLYF